MLPLPSCFRIPLAELSAGSGLDCSQKSFWSFPIPVGRGLGSSPSQDGSEARIQDEIEGVLACEQAQDHAVLSTNGRKKLRKRFYILFVARGNDGQLRKIPIPLHYLYVVIVGAVIGGLSLTGIASSYLRMVFKVSQFDQLRTEKEELKNRYSRLEQVATERDIQVASLGSLAGEVSSLYGLKPDPGLVATASDHIQDAQINSSLDQLYALRTSALTGATMTLPDPLENESIPSTAKEPFIVASI